MPKLQKNIYGEIMTEIILLTFAWIFFLISWAYATIAVSHEKPSIKCPNCKKTFTEDEK